MLDMSISKLLARLYQYQVDNIKPYTFSRGVYSYFCGFIVKLNMAEITLCQLFRYSTEILLLLWPKTEVLKVLKGILSPLTTARDFDILFDFHKEVRNCDKTCLAPT